MPNAKWDSYVEAPRRCEMEKQLKILCKRVGVECDAHTVDGPWSLFGTIDTVFFKINGEVSKVQLVIDSVKKSVDEYNNS